MVAPYSLSRSLAAVLAGPLLLAMAAPAAFAQATPGNNFQRLPGVILPDTQNPFTGRPTEINPGDAVPEDAKKPAEEPIIKDEQPEAPVIDPELLKPIQINDIRVEGVTKLSEAEVEAIIAPYEGKATPLPDLQEAIADQLTDLYEKKGYITTLVFIPPQTIDGGVLTVRADEGVISEVRFEGVKYYYPPIALRPQLNLEEGEVFKVQQLRDSLRRMNENPDLTLQATLKAGQESGQTEVVLSPKFQQFFAHVAPFYDNMGRTPIGLYRYGVTISDNNLFGIGDRGFVSPFFTDHSWGLINGYELPIGSRGTKVGITMAHTAFEIHDANNIEFRGKSKYYLPYISQELFRNERAVVSAEVAVGVKQSKFYALDNRVSEDKLITVNPALNARLYDGWGQTFIREELGIGSLLNGKTDGSRISTGLPNDTGAGRAFFKSTTTISRY